MFPPQLTRISRVCECAVCTTCASVCAATISLIHPLCLSVYLYLRWEPWHQGDRAGVHCHSGARVFLFWWELIFFLEKNEKKTCTSVSPDACIYNAEVLCMCNKHLMSHSCHIHSYVHTLTHTQHFHSSTVLCKQPRETRTLTEAM
jgi:hypothetical protein